MAPRTRLRRWTGREPTQADCKNVATEPGVGRRGIGLRQTMAAPTLREISVGQRGLLNGEGVTADRQVKQDGERGRTTELKNKVEGPISRARLNLVMYRIEKPKRVD